jgi:hypothetical protein
VRPDVSDGSPDELDRLEGLGGALSARELFPAPWMTEHTNVSDVEEFVRRAEREGVEASPGEEEWDDYVAATTAFEDWRSMLTRAIADRGGRADDAE